VKPVREPDAGNPHVRFDERRWETEPRSRLRHRYKAKAAGNSYSLVLQPPRPPSTLPTDENLQARLRAVILSAYVNRHGGFLLNTSNKTELALGYGTLYGDLAGALSPLGDLTQPQVYALAHWLSAHRAPIPSFILERPPAAELAPDQVDPFDDPRIAPAVEAMVQGSAVPEGLAEEELENLARRLRSSEIERFQHGIVLKVSERAFGSGRLMPVTRA